MCVQTRARAAIIRAPMLRPLVSIAFVVAALAGQEDAPTPATLRHGLAGAEPFQFSIEVGTRLSHESQKQDTSMRFAMQFRAEPGATKEGATTVTCTLESLVVHADSPNTTIRFDSADVKSDSGPLQRLRDLKGATFVLVVEPTGKMRSAEIPSPLAKLADEHLGSDFRSLFATYFLPLPDAPRAAGDEWEATTRMFGERIGGIETPTRLRCTANAAGRAEIELQFEAPNPPQRPGVRFELRRADGKAVLDTAKGRVVSAEATLLARATRLAGGANPTATSQLQVRASLLPAEPKPTTTQLPEGGTKN